MVKIMRMPGVLAGAESGVIHSWAIEENQELSSGQTIAEVETEKATVEIEAEFSGIVGRRLISEGGEAEVGAPILAVLEPGDTEQDIDKALERRASRALEAKVDTEVTTSSFDVEEAQEGSGLGGKFSFEAERLFASPIVRRMAHEYEVPLADLEGTGPGGRIVRRDLERYLAKSAPTVSKEPSSQPIPEEPTEAQQSASYQDVPISGMRKAIARRLTQSKAEIPHFYLSLDCDVTALLELRNTVNEASDLRISVNDFVLKAVARAMVEVPSANAIWHSGATRQFNSVDLAMAVAVEGGLVTPVIRRLETLSISAVSQASADLVERARIGSLKQQELEGGSFTVSNLGMYGIHEFAAIINPPQAGIVAIGAARAEPKVASDNQVVVRQIMTVTLSADHRVLDGVVAAEWLAAFKSFVESPMNLLI